MTSMSSIALVMGNILITCLLGWMAITVLFEILLTVTILTLTKLIDLLTLDVNMSFMSLCIGVRDSSSATTRDNGCC